MWLREITAVYSKKCNEKHTLCVGKMLEFVMLHKIQTVCEGKAEKKKIKCGR
jgi:hypothetical protein